MTTVTHAGPIRIGIGGPVGAGKTQLIERITRRMSSDVSMAAITNDIYTIEDAKILAATSVLPEDRIIGVETGGAVLCGLHSPGHVAIMLGRDLGVLVLGGR